MKRLTAKQHPCWREQHWDVRFNHGPQTAANLALINEFGRKAFDLDIQPGVIIRRALEVYALSLAYIKTKDEILDEFDALKEASEGK